MPSEKKRFPISMKMHLFIILTVFIVSIGIALVSYIINVIQIDNYCKRLAYNSGENFVSSIDTEYFQKLTKAAQTEEFQKLRETAEQTQDEALIEDYLKENGLWDEYVRTRQTMCTVIEKMEDIKYLYVIVLGDKFATEDMYLLDDYDNPLYQTGNYEDREPELMFVDTTQKMEPTITTGKWGWLCSAYVPVYAKDGSIICHVGCDVDMEGTMTQRLTYLLYMIITVAVVMTVVIILDIIFFNKFFVKPLKLVTEEAKKFNPEGCTDYEEAGVINLRLKSNDEISDIYESIRASQMNVIDYLKDMAKLEKDKQHYINILEQVESDIRDKEDQLDKISMEAYHDELTQAGNKNAYVRKVDEMSKRISRGIGRFAIAMIDLNNLKRINDYYGHKAGDAYIKGSCDIITNVFKHSPVFRIGGDEFVVTLTGMDYHDRDALIQQIKMEFYKSYYNNSVPPQERYCAAIGMAVYEPGDTYESVFKRADQAMYVDKMNFKSQNGSYR